MAEDLSEKELREKAEKRVKQRMALLYSIGLWFVFSVFFFLIWVLTDSIGFHSGDSFKYPWFLWIVGAWGFAVLIQVVGYLTGKRSDAAQDRMVEKEVERMKRGG